MIQVLFVDDDRVTLKLVKGILEGAGYSVIAVADPREALDVLERENVDILISDANMPGGVSGFDLVRTIRTMYKFKDLPIALLTGRREKRDIQMGLQSGADDYIIKPIDPLILLGKIETLLKKRTLQVQVTPFAERSVRAPATWDVDTQITQVSEQGMTIWSALSSPVDAKLRVKSEFFGVLGIDPPMLRVIGFSRDPNNPTMYFINTAFIGMNDNEMQKIRSWLMTSPQRSLKVS